MAYIRNKNCGCVRCSLGTMMGPAIMITLGLLFLVDQMTHYGFHTTWPVLLIVIGIMRVLGDNGSTEGHIDPYTQASAPAAPAPAEEVRHG